MIPIYLATASYQSCSRHDLLDRYSSIMMLRDGVRRRLSLSANRDDRRMIVSHPRTQRYISVVRRREDFR